MKIIISERVENPRKLRNSIIDNLPQIAPEFAESFGFEFRALSATPAWLLGSEKLKTFISRPFFAKFLRLEKKMQKK